VLGIKPGASYILSTHSTTKPHSQRKDWIFSFSHKRFFHIGNWWTFLVTLFGPWVYLRCDSASLRIWFLSICPHTPLFPGHGILKQLPSGPVNALFLKCCTKSLLLSSKRDTKVGRGVWSENGHETLNWSNNALEMSTKMA
jgi:hypothetical protein